MQILTSLAHRVSLLVFYRFPELGEKVFEMSTAIIEDERAKTKAIVEDVVNSSTGYLFTNDDLYLIAHGAMQPTGAGSGGAGETMAKEKLEDQQQQEEAENAQVGGFYRMRDGLAQQVEAAKNYIQNGGKTKHYQSKYSPAFIRDIRNRLEAYFKLVGGLFVVLVLCS